MPIIDVAGAELYYESAGTGEPLVLIPGFASGIWSWKYQIRDLTELFRVIAFDPRGISRSRNTEATPVSIERIADDVAALLDELGIESANILGISFGGFVAQDLALRYPGRINRLVLACTSYGGKGHVLPSMDILAAFASTKGLNSIERIRQYLTVAFSPSFVADEPGIVDEFCRLREQNEVPESVYMAQLLSATTFDLSARVGQIRVETLVLSGDNDTIVPKQNSINLAAAIPNARLEIVAGGSHMFFVEQSKRFNSIVTDFLEGNQ
jgi:pimeloyl-ACP methyl ester carboxylesterase